VRWFFTTAGTTLVLLTAIGSSSAQGGGGFPASSIDTTAPIIRLAAGGTTVVAVLGSKETECADETLIWDVRRGTPVVMQGKGDSVQEANLCPQNGNTDLAVAVGGGMVGVLRFGSDHEEESVLRVTRIPTNGRWTDITGVYDYAYGAGEGDYLSVLGDGPILAFNKWTICFVYNPGDLCPGVSEGKGWWVSNGQLVEVRAPGARSGSTSCPSVSGEDPNYEGIPWPSLATIRACRNVGRGASFLRVVALDQGRFLALPAKGNVTIISARNGQATQLPIPTSTVRQADLDGRNLLVLRKSRTGSIVLEVHDASTGALHKTWGLSSSPAKSNSVHLEDAHSGIVVYRVGTTIHVLRLRDGKTHTIIPANQGPVHARLEDPGLIYSFSIPGRPPRGRIEFVPLAHLLAQLR
jgi:hypothetical protein